jgi:Putative DNA-binding domain
VPALLDLQKHVRDAVVLNGGTGLDSLLLGGRDPSRRLAIHQRHYRVSLTRALLERFPATVWLVGSSFVTNAAHEFVCTQPPSRPCIAEYGETFPEFLSTRSGAAEIPYLRGFAELEWHLSRLALAVEAPSLTIGDLSTGNAAAVGDAKVALQPGVHYFHADWAVDELISLYLSGDASDHFTLQAGDVWLEIRGMRGELSMNRLRHSEFTFRAALAADKSVSDAALSALEIEAAFDPGAALLHLVRDGLITAVHGTEGDA